MLALAVVGLIFAAVWTAILFLVIQQVEGNVLMPVIQKRASALPPVLTILAVVAFGVLFGFMGVFLATPLLLVALGLAHTLDRRARIVPHGEALGAARAAITAALRAAGLDATSPDAPAPPGTPAPSGTSAPL